MRITGYVVDSNKVEGSLAQRTRGNSGSYGYIGKNLDGVPCYKPQGSFIDLDEAKCYFLNRNELIYCSIDSKDLFVSGDFDHKIMNTFARYGKKFKIIERGYKPNRFNVRNYL